MLSDATGPKKVNAYKLVRHKKRQVNLWQIRSKNANVFHSDIHMGYIVVNGPDILAETDELPGINLTEADRTPRFLSMPIKDTIVVI